MLGDHTDRGGFQNANSNNHDIESESEHRQITNINDTSDSSFKPKKII